MMARPRKYRPPDVLAGDLRDALRSLRRGFGRDQVIVLTVIRHQAPADLERRQLEHTARLFTMAPEFGLDREDR
jgi:hypothetical protein